jgi:hypothetical protein
VIPTAASSLVQFLIDDNSGRGILPTSIAKYALPVMKLRHILVTEYAIEKFRGPTQNSGQGSNSAISVSWSLTVYSGKVAINQDECQNLAFSL